MPKPRADLQVVAYRVNARLRKGNIAAVPIYPLSTEWSELDRWPSVILLLDSLRIRLPALYSDSRRKYEAKYELTWYNRVTIPPSVLNSRFVGVSRKSPDYEWLMHASREQRRAVGVIETSLGLKRRIYEVVRDLSHGQRQPIHVRLQYEDEKAKLETIRMKLRERLRQEAAGLLILSDEEIEIAQLTSAQIGFRIEEIERILMDRAVRETRLASYARMSNLQLFLLAESLAEFKSSFARMPKINIAAVQRYLQGFLSDLALYGSREIRNNRNYAQNLIRRIIDNMGDLERAEIVRLLNMAVEHLTRAANIMTGWADSLSAEEKLIVGLASLPGDV